MLLLALEQGDAPAEITAIATITAPDAGFAEWVAGWDPDLVSLASHLVQTWARRSPTEAP